MVLKSLIIKKLLCLPPENVTSEGNAKMSEDKKKIAKQ